MEKKEITTHRALTELKTLDRRISEAIGNGTFVVANRYNNQKISGMTLEDYKAKVLRAAFQKVEDLISYRNQLKRAVILSNAGIDLANEEVMKSLKRYDIAKEQMTLAEIIDYETVLKYKICFLDVLKRQYREANKEVVKQNNCLDQNLQKYLSVAANGRDAKNSEDDTKFIKSLSDDYIQQNTYDLIDPLNLQDKIDALADEIDAYTVDIDAIKSEANAQVKIVLNA